MKLTRFEDAYSDYGLDLALDQTPAFDPTEPEPVPNFDFDASRGD